MDQAIEVDYIQQSVEFSALIVAVASLSNQSSQSVHLQPHSPSHSMVSTFSLVISQSIIPTIPIVITTTPATGPSSSQSFRPVMAGRYEPLVLPGNLNFMPGITNLKF